MNSGGLPNRFAAKSKNMFGCGWGSPQPLGGVGGAWYPSYATLNTLFPHTHTRVRTHAHMCRTCVLACMYTSTHLPRAPTHTTHAAHLRHTGSSCRRQSWGASGGDYDDDDNDVDDGDDADDERRRT